MAQQLSKKALGYSLAILSAICMILIWVGGNVGIYEGMFEMMQNAHLFFSANSGLASLIFL